MGEICDRTNRDKNEDPKSSKIRPNAPGPFYETARTIPTAAPISPRVMLPRTLPDKGLEPDFFVASVCAPLAPPAAVPPAAVLFAPVVELT